MSPVNTSATRTKPIFKLNQPDDNYKFLPLPEPFGKYPYHLKPNLGNPDSQKMFFHVAGDTGGIKSPAFQRLVADEMAKQCLSTENRPDFLFHLGDIVYHFGEASQYEQQFFNPYKNYPLPIYAIAGNHDSDINPLAETPYPSLYAFSSVFCGTEPRIVPFGEKKDRKSGIQPHVYWTLQTPLANIIGLHSNVPKFGVITDEQKLWFIEELRNAALEKADKAIIVCIHHAPYSADTNHGSSLPMIRFMEESFEAAGIRADLVLSGHVHNYQRFEKHYQDGVTVPFIVSGAGGFDELHELAAPEDPRFTNDNALFDHVELKSACVMQHGFLKLGVEKNADGIRISGSYYVIPHEGLQEEENAMLFEHFEFDLHR
jgi:predicted phosphodiesterase